MKELQNQPSSTRRNRVFIPLGCIVASVLAWALVIIVMTGRSFHADGYWGTWERATHPNNPVITSIAIGEGSTFVGTVDARVFRSVDGEETWEPFGEGLHGSKVLCLHVDPHTSQLYAITSEGAYRSGVGRGSWTRIRDPGLEGGQDVSIAGVSRAAGVVLLMSVDDALYRSTDGGDSWAQIPFETRSNIEKVLAMSNDRVLLFEHSVHTSLDGGLTWELVLGLDDQDNWIGTVASHPVDLSNVVFHSQRTLFLSHDAGRSWTRMATPYSHPDAIAVTGSAPRFVLAAIDGMAFLHETGAPGTGGDWQGWAFPDVRTRVLAVDPADLARVVAGTDRGVAVSVDNGKSWEWRNEGLESAIRAMDLIVAGGRVYAPGRWHATLFSEDDGKSWQEMENGEHSIDTSIVVRPGHPCQILRARPLSVSRSTDCGATWSVHECEGRLEMQTGGDDVSVVYGDDNRGSIVRSDDFGLTWRLVFEGTSNEFTVDPLDANHVYVASRQVDLGVGPAAAIVESRDGGESWQVLDSSFIAERSVLALAAPADGSENLIVGTGYGAWRYISAENRWHQIFERDTPVFDIVQDRVHEGVLYTCTADGVFGSEDDGVSWVELGLPAGCRHMAVTADGKVVLAATEQEVYRMKRIAGWRLVMSGLVEMVRRGVSGGERPN